MKQTTPRHFGAARRRQAGLTLVELMVALVLGLLVAAAAVGALIVARQGFTSVDGSSQLRENARFAASIIQRIGVQAGYENLGSGDTRWKRFCPDCDSAVFGIIPGMRGYDDSLVTAAALPNALLHGSRTTDCTVSDTSCANGSDVLIVRYWGDTKSGGAAGNGSMINCAGAAVPEGTVPAYSVFHVARSAAGEPTLACTYIDATTAAWTTVPLVQGVEGFQLLFGVDNVVAGTAPPADDAGTDSVPDLYLRPSQIDVAGDAVATANNWRRVRSVRVGLVIRGPVGSAVDRAATAQTYPVLGQGFSRTADVGSDLTITAPDGRLRQSVVFTVHLRNPQFVVPATLN